MFNKKSNSLCQLHECFSQMRDIPNIIRVLIICPNCTWSELYVRTYHHDNNLSHKLNCILMPFSFYLRWFNVDCGSYNGTNDHNFSSFTKKFKQLGNMFEPITLFQILQITFQDHSAIIIINNHSARNFTIERNYNERYEPSSGAIMWPTVGQMVLAHGLANCR